MARKPFKKNVYVQLRHEIESERKFEIGEHEAVAKQLKPLIVGIVERAFRRFCNAHNADKEMEEREWQRFKRILNGML